MKNDTWKIYWNEYVKDTYIYGSEISFVSKDEVKYKNMLLPPSTIIKRWHSKTNFQASRVEPSLPMIDGEGIYHISLDVDKESVDKLFLRIVFYDRYDYEISSIIVRDIEKDFRCPIRTYSYEVQLISSGVKEFTFHSITIMEIIDE